MTTLWTFPQGVAWEGETAEDAAEELQTREKDLGGRRRFNPAKAVRSEHEDYFDFKARYGIRRHGKTAIGDPERLETFGEELKQVLAIDKHNPKCVWTVVDGENEQSYITAGYHYVDRQCYFISRKPWVTGQEIFLW